MRAALAIAAALLLAALLPGGASAAACGKHQVGSGSDQSIARITTSRVGCARGVSVIDRWYTRASPRCSGGKCPTLRVKGFKCRYRYGSGTPTVRCADGRRVVKGRFGV
jgi:hypothetical protein